MKKALINAYMRFCILKAIYQNAYKMQSKNSQAMKIPKWAQYIWQNNRLYTIAPLRMPSGKALSALQFHAREMMRKDAADMKDLYDSALPRPRRWWYRKNYALYIRQLSKRERLLCTALSWYAWVYLYCPKWSARAGGKESKAHRKAYFRPQHF